VGALPLSIPRKELERQNEELRRQARARYETSELRRRARKLLPALIKRSGGTCDLCPFRVEALLVPHHIRFVENGGESDMNNLVPVCPNCHALIHYVQRQPLSLREQRSLLLNCQVTVARPNRLLAFTTQAVAVDDSNTLVDRRLFHPSERPRRVKDLRALGITLIENHGETV
jgi:hypothetical protein